MAPRKASRCDHAFCVTTTRVALQLKPALFVSDEAMFRPWKARSDLLHGPGTMMIGLTLPSSLVMRFLLRGFFSALRFAPSAPTPKTIASWVLSEPVMWISSIAGCWQRYSPSLPPPYTMRNTPRRMSGASALSSTGPRYSFTGFIFKRTTWFSWKSL